MADGTGIEWTEATWSPVTGCSVVSPGCTNCYAMRLAGTRLKHHPSRAGLTRMTKAGPVWTGEVRFNDYWLDQPLRWKRPRMIFVVAHGDLFHQSVTDDVIDKVFAVMALAPQHTFQVLTKRHDRMHQYMTLWPEGMGRHHHVAHAAHGILAPNRHNGWSARDASFIKSCEAVSQDRWPLPNVWMGVSAEDEWRARERIPVLLETPAAVRWVSAEPLVGPITHSMRGLDWCVVGGESGPGFRPMPEQWAKDIVTDCQVNDVPVFVKQMAGKAEIPPYLKVREWPLAAA